MMLNKSSFSWTSACAKTYFLEVCRKDSEECEKIARVPSAHQCVGSKSVQTSHGARRSRYLDVLEGILVHTFTEMMSIF